MRSWRWRSFPHVTKLERLIDAQSGADITQILSMSQSGSFHNLIIYFLKPDTPLCFYINSLIKVGQTRLYFNLLKITVNKTNHYIYVSLCLYWCCFLTTVLYIVLYCITWRRPPMAETCTDYKNKYSFYNEEISCWLYYFKYAESLQHNGMPLLKNNYTYCITITPLRELTNFTSFIFSCKTASVV